VRAVRYESVGQFEWGSSIPILRGGVGSGVGGRGGKRVQGCRKCAKVEVELISKDAGEVFDVSGRNRYH
jgi:hypothetical protein